MSNLLEALHQLQEVETQLATIRIAIDAKQRRIDLHRKQVKTTEDRIEQNERAKRERTIRCDAQGLDVATREQSIAKHREALGTAKTNKAYADILAAMNTEKADLSKIESGILQLLEEIQNSDKDGETIKLQQKELLAKVKTAEKLLAKYEAEVCEDLERLEAERARLAVDVPAGALSLFTRVARHHDGEAMALVMKLHPKREEYACTGCNLNVTLEVINILHKGDALQLCSSCGRVLYLETEPVGRA